jgi:opacity protein-like surface antigen
MRRAIGQPTSSRRAASKRAGVIAALVVALAPWAAQAAERTAAKATPLGSRFYGGVDVAAIHYDDKYADIAFAGSSIGLGLYSGFRVNDHLSVELAYDEATAIDKHNVAGSGTAYFNVETELHSVSVRVQRQFSLRELFNLPRDWSAYAMFGVFDNNLDRTVTDLASYKQVSVQEQKGGAVGGVGMLYRLGRMELRGGFRFWSDARDLDFAAQFRF